KPSEARAEGLTPRSSHLEQLRQLHLLTLLVIPPTEVAGGARVHRETPSGDGQIDLDETASAARGAVHRGFLQEQIPSPSTATVRADQALSAMSCMACLA